MERGHAGSAPSQYTSLALFRMIASSAIADGCDVCTFEDGTRPSPIRRELFFVSAVFVSATVIAVPTLAALSEGDPWALVLHRLAVHGSAPWHFCRDASPSTMASVFMRSVAAIPPHLLLSALALPLRRLAKALALRHKHLSLSWTRLALFARPFSIPANQPTPSNVAAMVTITARDVKASGGVLFALDVLFVGLSLFPFTLFTWNAAEAIMILVPPLLHAASLAMTYRALRVGEQQLLEGLLRQQRGVSEGKQHISPPVIAPSSPWHVWNAALAVASCVWALVFLPVALVAAAHGPLATDSGSLFFSIFCACWSPTVRGELLFAALSLLPATVGVVVMRNKFVWLAPSTTPPPASARATGRGPTLRGAAARTKLVFLLGQYGIILWLVLQLCFSSAMYGVPWQHALRVISASCGIAVFMAELPNVEPPTFHVRPGSRSPAAPSSLQS